MTQTTKSERTSKVRRDVWSVAGLEERCQALIASGLLRDGKIDEICATINKEFAEQLKDVGAQLSKTALIKRLSKLVWTSAAIADLKRTIRMGLSLEDFHSKFYPYIPEKMVKAKARRFKGLSKAMESADFKAGLGRISTEELPTGAEKFEFPSTSAANPYVVSVGSEWQIVVVNGSSIGTAFDANIDDNVTRRALADAKKRGASAVVLTNLFTIDTKKTGGPIKVYRAAASGIQINPERFPREYRQEVRDILSGKLSDKLIYQTLAEKFAEILDGMRKITHRPDGVAEFTGPVLYALGYLEEELIAAAAYHECRHLTVKHQPKIDAELKLANRKLSEAPGSTYWSDEVERLERLKSRTIISNITDAQYDFYRRRMRALVVKKLEAAIPNCTVISQGSAYLKIGQHTVKLHIPHHDKVTDALLAEYCNSYGKEVFRDTLADLTVICHPFALNHRDVGREDSKDGRPVTKFVTVAPICVDDEFLRERLGDATKFVPNIAKAVFDPQFKPGVLVISCSDGNLRTDALPIKALNNATLGRDRRSFVYPYPKTHYITWALNTDNHFGAPDKRFIWDPQQGVHLGVTEAAFEMMRRLKVVTPSDIRIHGTAEMDDATQGDLWFKQRYRPDPNMMLKSNFVRWLRHLSGEVKLAAERGDAAAVVELTDRINRLVTEQQNLRGDDFPFHQMMEVMDVHIDAQADVYSAILGRLVKSGLAIRGISQIQRTLSDTRDLAAINFPEGNHRINTMEQADLEGDWMALRLQGKIAQRPEWRGYVAKHPDFLEQMIRAPRFGNATFGWGLIGLPGGYQWGMRVHGSPARQSGWSDILAASVKSDLSRGDDSYGLGKYVTVTLYGDKHFYAKAETGRNIYVMCAAGVHTNMYGSTGGFPPNNTGVCFLSLPADGPDAGPIIMRRLTHDFLRDWFANPTPFDWEKFLPEPV